MKVLNIDINGEKFLSNKISAFHSREARKIQKDSILLAKKGRALTKGIEGDGMDETDEIMSILDDLANRKACLICEIYGNKFTSDDLEKHLSDGEIDAAINSILFAVDQTLSKN